MFKPTKCEVNLLAELLEMASDEFANHGCNDFDLSKFIPDTKARNDFVEAMYVWNGDPEEFVWSDKTPDWRVQDWCLMRFMADMIRTYGEE